jgi:hypothetical protein
MDKREKLVAWSVFAEFTALILLFFTGIKFFEYVVFILIGFLLCAILFMGD